MPELCSPSLVLRLRQPVRTGDAGKRDCVGARQLLGGQPGFQEQDSSKGCVCARHGQRSSPGGGRGTRACFAGRGCRSSGGSSGWTSR